VSIVTKKCGSYGSRLLVRALGLWNIKEFEKERKRMKARVFQVVRLYEPTFT
jgi:hypothetical protein